MSIPNGMFVVGNKLMTVCGWCEKVVRVDKPIIGSFHLCLTDEEKERKSADLRERLKRQRATFRDRLGSAGSGQPAKPSGSEAKG